MTKLWKYTYYRLLVGYGGSSRASGPLMVLLALNLASVVCILIRIMQFLGVIRDDGDLPLWGILSFVIALTLSTISIFIYLGVCKSSLQADLDEFKKESKEMRRKNGKEF